MPPIADDCVIIKTEYVGLNPVDTKMVGPFVGAGANYGVSLNGVPFIYLPSKPCL
jgi:NADPH:quinone reductase-like Zn-dependent oxidoreductase